MSDSGGNVVISTLHPPEALVPNGSTSRVVDLTGSVAGFSDSMTLKDLERRVLDECKTIVVHYGVES